MESRRPLNVPDAPSESAGPEVRRLAPGSTMYILHEMREVELTPSAVLAMLHLHGTAPAGSAVPDATLTTLVEALRLLDARLFVPADGLEA